MLNAVGVFLNTIIKQGSYETVSKTMQNYTRPQRK